MPFRLHQPVPTLESGHQGAPEGRGPSFRHGPEAEGPAGLIEIPLRYRFINRIIGVQPCSALC